MPTLTWAMGKTWVNEPITLFLNILYERYIDDVIIICQGSEAKIYDLICYCNSNSHGITFASMIDKKVLTFLDVDLFQDDSVYMDLPVVPFGSTRTNTKTFEGSVFSTTLNSSQDPEGARQTRIPDHPQVAFRKARNIKKSHSPQQNWLSPNPVLVVTYLTFWPSKGFPML